MQLRGCFEIKQAIFIFSEEGDEKVKFFISVCRRCIAAVVVNFPAGVIVSKLSLYKRHNVGDFRLSKVNMKVFTFILSI